MNSKVDAYIESITKWKAEVELLRAILLTTELDEDFKWGRPCYSFNGKNIISLTPLKDHCALNVFHGGALSDPMGVLIQPGAHTQMVRWMKFSSVGDIKKHTLILKSFVAQSITIVNAGIKRQKVKAPALPIELKEILSANPKLKKAFEALTPGRQRAYIIFFSTAKQSETRIARINKFKSRILSGKGLTDCTCGLSKKMPGCDGSHKFAKK